jgi:dTDP-4-dehydrorhamnose reductase
VAWAEEVARACAERGVRFVFTGSVSVFGSTQRGPFAPDAVPEPDDDYGRYKLEAERRVRAAHPGAVVARLAWQIGEAPGANHLVDYLHRTAEAEGRVEASTRWVPACAFLDDTAAALVGLAERGAPGLYHLDGNPGLSLYEIAIALNRLHGAPWTVVPVEEPDRDTRMVDHRISTRPITARLVR